MVTAGHNFDPLLIARNASAVDDAVVAGNASRPPAAEIAAQWLRLAQSFERVSPNIL
jgi:hypothetical protein